MFGVLVGAHLCVRPWTKAACLQRADTQVGPYRGSNVDLYFGGVANHDGVQRAGHAPPLQVADVFGILMGLHMLVVCSGRGKPRPYKGTRQVCHLCRERACPFRHTNERSVTWRSDLFISVTYMNTFMRIPGPGPQARCGKGVWSPEDQGDRCRVPRSFGPSGAGREQVKLLKRIQQDDLPTKGDTACGPTPHPSAAPTPSPLGEGSTRLLSGVVWGRG